MQVTVLFCSVPWGGEGPPTSLPLPPTTRVDLKLNGYLEYPHAAKALYIYRHPYLLRDSNPDPTAPQSASLTTTPDGRHTYSKLQLHAYDDS
ncbi:uncharacterized protein TNCV_3050691 [Trichonephila clavipes]|nr:uncharacterized protein TNCV_3050691 [Trichonephila clavipes]